MEINYESICRKLGFTPGENKYNLSDYEDDSKTSPYAVLTLDELDFLCEYMKKNKPKRKNL